MVFLILITLLPLLFPSTALAQVVINELGVTSSPDWIEIYNYDEQSVDLSSFIVKDESGNVLVMNGTIESKGFKSFNWSNRLNKNGDIVWLIRVSDQYKIEELRYGDKGGVCIPTTEDGSIGKIVDGQGGSGRLERYSKSSKDLSNSEGIIDPCPTPTLEPTHTPTPTPKPTDTPSPTPKPSATKIPTPTPKPKLEETIKITKTQESNNTLGIKGTNQQVSPSPYPMKETDASIPFPAIGLIIVGVGLVIASFYPYLKKLKKAYNFRK